MAEAARWFVGAHDFTSFAASSAPEESEPDDAGAVKPERPDSGSAGPLPEPKSMVRTVFVSRLLWRERTRILTYEVRGSGFLHHMVRNMVGTMVEVGRGKIPPCEVIRILEARDRSLAGPTAPPQGLCLVGVEY